MAGLSTLISGVDKLEDVTAPLYPSSKLVDSARRSDSATTGGITQLEGHEGLHRTLA